VAGFSAAPLVAAAPARTGDVKISKVLANPDLEAGATHEYVDLTNHDAEPIQLEGWRLTDAIGTAYTFPAFELASGASVRLHVAEGDDSATDLYWERTGFGKGTQIFNNTGDTANLYDSSGTLVHSVEC
jgi:hypothetical protein